MALARLVMKDLQQKTAGYVSKNAVLFHPNANDYIIGKRLGGVHSQGWSNGLLRRLSSSTISDGKEVSIQSDEGSSKKSNLSRKWKSVLPRPFRRSSNLWKRKDNNRDTHPLDIFPPASLGNALFEAAENMNRLFDSMIPTTQLAAPSLLMGKFKETDESYKLRFDVPGLTKEDVKVTVDDGVLRIRGERKVEEDESDDEYMMSYGYYNTSLVLPDDCKQDDIMADMKDGVLTITIPKTQSHGKDVKQIQVN